jgi:hypothetical protein
LDFVIIHTVNGIGLSWNLITLENYGDTIRDIYPESVPNVGRHKPHIMKELNGVLAQLGERLPCTHEVIGS